MCGFVGLFNPAGIPCVSGTTTLVETMRDRLAHRGPDDAGVWLEPAGGLALGSRRLAIQDLSPAGHQPMLSADGRWVLALNGEIYNAAEIRAEIEAAFGAVAWRGHSDTEVLVEAIARWGVAGAIPRANGMFAVAAWDRWSRKLSLVRDRIGMKPLYYGWAGDEFVFASEIKALWPHPKFDNRIDIAALTDFLRLGYVLGSRSIFRDIQKLPPGTILEVDPGARPGKVPQPFPFWSLKNAAFAGMDARESGNPATTEELHALLRDAVGIRMVADVPLGGLLSGGIDSSLIVALMAEQAGGPVRTYSIGYGMPRWDEIRYARAVAKYVGTTHKEIVIGPADVLALMNELPTIYDEPFADDSMIPTTLLSRLARGDVTIAMSGDGGDELFGGYDRYMNAAGWLERRRGTPAMARQALGAVSAYFARPASRHLGWNRFERRFQLLAELLSDDTAEYFNAAIMSRSLDPGELMTASTDGNNPLMQDAYCLGRGTDIDRIMFMDSGSYLPDDILAKVDRASMSASLEVRCPLLDYRVIEMSWRFPVNAKTRGATGKLPLRNILHRYVPRPLVERPKMGFSAPVQVWLLNELRDWAESLMSREALASHGLLNVNVCRRFWDDFATRGRAWNPMIWSLLMFQAWHVAMVAATTGSRTMPPNLSTTRIPH